MSDTRLKDFTNVLKEFYSKIKPVNNLTSTEEGRPLDAVQGKILNDKIEAISGSTESNSGKTGILKLGASGTTAKITCGFKPKKIYFHVCSTGGQPQVAWYYDAEISTTACYLNTGTSNVSRNLGSSNCILKSIDNDGFTLNIYTTSMANLPTFYCAE
ncbi:MAG: hypothetical protein ACI4VG_03540 [Lachnospiraceae bacterium]